MDAKFYLLWYVNSGYSIPLAITSSGVVESRVILVDSIVISSFLLDL
jgi:hypothetical protein